ncbi:MAG: HAD-IA family hydrolase [Cytophagales bacterium]|nr:HAD-IA family hydrolase [Armatimonadota bacterium]
MDTTAPNAPSKAADTAKDDPPLVLLDLPLPFIPKAAIFDCDGTLADTMPLHYAAWREVLDLVGAPLPVFPVEQFYAWGGVTAKEILHRLNTIHGLHLDTEAVAHRKEMAYRQQIPTVRPIEKVVAEARRFYGVCPIAVASGGMRMLVQETLETIGVGDLFEIVVGSEDVKDGKPAPEVFLTAAARLGVDPADCIVYEDAPAGLEAARRAGMRAVNVVDYL